MSISFWVSSETHKVISWSYQVTSGSVYCIFISIPVVLLSVSVFVLAYVNCVVSKKDKG